LFVLNWFTAMNTTHHLQPDWRFPLCPTAPDWSIPWPQLLATFPELRTLENCPQDPEYHAEGNVLIHTQMVCTALVHNLAWQQLPTVERSILFTAALFHDIAKPSTTARGEDGRWHARGHGKKGGGMVRSLLAAMHTPFAIREAIVNIVTMGSLPLWFWDKPDPQRSVLFASQVSRCDWLALMADADLRGRICSDGQKFADSIAMFQEFCQEQGCWNQPFAFASEQSCYVYFHKESADPYYEVYDTTKFEVILTCAVPGTGKDYWIQQHYPDLPMVSLDELRSELDISPTGNQGKVVAAAHRLARNYLRQQTSFVWNATNVMASQRRSLVELFADYQAKVKIVYLEVPVDRNFQQNRNRERVVPMAVIDRFRRRMEIPNCTEAHRLDFGQDLG
jgi:putative nucleotidyltransferase with HDIG domain